MNSNVTISSYDVFDTLLTRRVCDPKAVFLFSGQEAVRRGLINIGPAAFRKARVEAESLARIGIPDGEADFDGIYKVLNRIIGCTASQLIELKQLELDWERKMILPIPGAKATVETGRRAGRQIHFMSEMYLPAEFLESLLRDHGFMQDGDKLWVSNTHKASKRSGRLFSFFLDKSGVNQKQVQHHGNDWSADVSAAQRLGITAVHHPQANPVHYESLLERHSPETNGWTSLMAGAGRLVRLQPNGNANLAELREVTAEVVCPALTGYVMWVLQQAKILAISRLYFISRDGYVPYLLAKEIAAKVLPNVECRYFYGSRQAWHLAGLKEVDEGALEWMLGHCDGVTCASLLNRLELTWEECQQFAPELTYAMGNPEAPVTMSVRQIAKAALQKNGPLLIAVRAKSKVKRDLVYDYAMQEGLLNGWPTGMVEIGWSGRTRASLERAFFSQNVTNLHWFYFGLHHQAKISDPGRIHYFLYGPELRRPEIPFLPVVIESFCLALHGSVTGYEHNGDKIAPTFRVGIEKQLESWGRGEVFETINLYLQHFSIEMGRFPEVGNLSEAIRDLITDFCINPSAKDAKIWGRIPFEHDQAAKNALPLALDARLTWPAVKNALIFGNVQRACMGDYVGTWGAGSWAARQKPLHLLRFIAILGYLRVHWKRLPKKFISKIHRVMSSLNHS